MSLVNLSQLFSKQTIFWKTQENNHFDPFPYSDFLGTVLVSKRFWVLTKKSLKAKFEQISTQFFNVGMRKERDQIINKATLKTCWQLQRNLYLKNFNLNIKELLWGLFTHPISVYFAMLCDLDRNNRVQTVFVWLLPI